MYSASVGENKKTLIGTSTVVRSCIYLSFENCECSKVTVTVSKVFLFPGSFRKYLVELTDFVFKMCGRESLDTT